MGLSPRFSAMLVILLLIGGMALAAIGATALTGTYMNGDTHTEHDAGKILRINDTNMDFSFLTTSGHIVQFECSVRCEAALYHMMRHEQERALTDVYYVQLMNNKLMALDVD